MPITRFGPNQVIDRFATIITPLFGPIDVVELGEIATAVTNTTLPSGQVRATGQIVASEISGAVMFADAAQVAQLESWKAMSDVGAPGYVQAGVQVIYYGEMDVPRAAVIIEECFLHTITYPATSQEGSGNGAKLGFTLSTFGIKSLAV